MSTVEVVYHLAAEDGLELARSQVALLPPWAGVGLNAEAVAAAVCEDHLDERTWAEFFFDSCKERLVVEIVSPPEVAGRFAVQVVLKPKATAKRLP